MSQITLTVEGMSCGHCVNAIETNVGKMNGVSSVKVDLSEKKVDVAFDDAVVGKNDIVTVIEDQGYDVK